MKKSFIALALVAAVSLAGCFEDAIKVTVPGTYTTSFTIKAPIPAQAVDTVASSTMITENEDFKKLNVTVDNVESAKLTSLKLTITSPTGTTFAALKSARFLIKDAAGGTILVANIPEGMNKNVTELEVELYDADFAPFVKTGEITLLAAIETLISIDEDIDITAVLVTDIKVKP
jgi:outer membrane lipoprotein SlyB